MVQVKLGKINNRFTINSFRYYLFENNYNDDEYDDDEYDDDDDLVMSSLKSLGLGLGQQQHSDHHITIITIITIAIIYR